MVVRHVLPNGNTVENGDIEEEACNPSPCPVDCDGSWETGRRVLNHVMMEVVRELELGIIMYRSKQVMVVHMYTSNGNTVENGDIEEEACNPSPCPVDCDGS